MTLDELAYITETKVVIDYIHDRRRFHAQLSDVRILNNGTIESAFGGGRTPELAQREYAKLLRGKRIAVGLSGPERREYSVPKSLVY